jgi:hypothetical protein
MNLYLSVWDIFLTPLYFIVLSAIARRQRDKRYPVGHPLRPYYLKGLYVKFAGCIFISLVYQFYYGGGDTSEYFRHIKIINSSINDSFSTWFKLLTHQSEIKNPQLYAYTRQMEWYNDPPSYYVAVIGAIFGILNGTNYMGIAMLMAFFSFTGTWAMYRTFVNIYPRLYKELAIAFLFIPSTVVWGSSIFKDTICMFALGWLTYTTFRIFINKDYSRKNILLLILSFSLVFKVKLYILLGFLPAAFLWLLITYSVKIKSPGVRFVVKTFFVALAIVAFLFFTRLFAESLKRYSLENIAETAQSTRQWLLYSSQKDEGSGYDLGEFDPTITGMLTKFPQGVVVTLFRPFPWEAKKVIVMLSALEALAFIYFTIKAFRKRGVFKTFALIGKDPNLLFCLIFSIIFAFAVGISTYNFGALSRYKIPCLPFYGAFVMIVLHYDKTTQSKQNLVHIKSFKKTPSLA